MPQNALQALNRYVLLSPGSDTAMVKQAIGQLKQEYEASGRDVRIDEVASGFRMTTASGFFRTFVRKLQTAAQ